MPDPERGYRWGRFQAWFSLFLAVVQLFLWRTFPLNVATGILLLFVWKGLLRKHRYGFWLVYVMAALALVGGLFGLAMSKTWDRVGSIVIAICFWGIPGAFYYPKRYREFGVGKPKQEIASVAVTPSEVEKAVVPNRTLTDEERQMVLDRIRRRSPQEKPTER